MIYNIVRYTYIYNDRLSARVIYLSLSLYIYILALTSTFHAQLK